MIYSLWKFSIFCQKKPRFCLSSREASCKKTLSTCVQIWMPAFPTRTMLTEKFQVTLLKSFFLKANTAPFTSRERRINSHPEPKPSRLCCQLAWQDLKYLRSQPLGNFLKFAFFMELKGAFLTLGWGYGDPGVKVSVRLHIFRGLFFKLLFELLSLHSSDVCF